MGYTTLPVAYNPGIDGEAGRIGDFYAPQWLANAAGGIQNVGSNQYLLGGNTGWRVGNDLYAANQWMGEPGAYGASSTNPAYDTNFLRYRLTPDQIAQFNAGNAAAINGSAYDVLDQNGNVVRSGNWEGIRNNSSTDMWDALVTAAVGGVFGGAATGALSSGAGAAPVASGAGGIGEGLANVGSLGAGGTVSSGTGALAGAGGVGAGAGSYASGVGAAGAAGSALGSGGGTNSYASTLQNILKGAGVSGDFNWTSLIGPLTQLAGGYLNASAASDASDAQLQAAREAAARFQPWTDAGAWGIGQAANMLGKNGQAAATAAFQQDPSYQWRLQQGENALTRAASARGLMGSGKYLKDAMSYNQNEASKEFGNSLNRLLAVAGMGQTATGSAADYTTQAGNAAAAGAVGRSNAYTNALTQGYSMYANQQQQDQNNALMNRILGSRGY